MIIVMITLLVADMSRGSEFWRMVVAGEMGKIDLVSRDAIVSAWECAMVHVPDDARCAECGSDVHYSTMACGGDSQTPRSDAERREAWLVAV